MTSKELNYKYALIVAANQRDLGGLVWESFREVRLRSGSTLIEKQRTRSAVIKRLDRTFWAKLRYDAALLNFSVQNRTPGVVR